MTFSRNGHIFRANINKNLMPDQTPWFKKKRYAIPLVVVSFIFVLAAIGSSQPNNSGSQTPTAPTPVATKTVEKSAVLGTSTQSQPVVTNTVVQPSAPSTPAPATNNNLSNSNTYVNSNGNTVHSPAYSEDNSVPTGATAKCGDGTYSFSQHRSGTCSHHGGVAEWLN